MYKKGVIIVAGGTGKRMQSALPKQFLELQGTPVLMHTINKFVQFDATMQIIVVLPEEQIEYWEKLCKTHNFNVEHQIVSGGSERFYSVKNGLSHVTNDLDVIAVHDGVRPFVSIETIERSFSAAYSIGSAVPVIELNDSIRQIRADKNLACDRSKFRLVQTPQVFRRNLLVNSYNKPYQTFFTDDASVVEASGIEITLVEGNVENIKLTTPVDFEWAEFFLQKSFKEI